MQIKRKDLIFDSGDGTLNSCILAQPFGEHCRYGSLSPKLLYIFRSEVAEPALRIQHRVRERRLEMLGELPTSSRPHVVTPA